MSKGKARRDFVSITKLCQNINKLIKIKSRNLDRYNFTSGYSFSMSDIAKIVSEEAKNLFKSNIPIFYSNKYKDKVNSFKVSSKLKIYKNKKILDQELRDEIKKILLILNEN